MRKIRNPFVGLERYNCFGCSPDNVAGLRLSFYEDGDYLTSVWEPKDHFHGYMNVLHGGIQATLIDEIASWVVYVKLKTSGMTSNLSVRYHKPVFVDKGNLSLRAHVREMRRNLADIEVQLFDEQGNLCTEGIVTYFTFPLDKSRKHLYYPDHNEFFEEDDGERE
jgi:uncharacterized protein (TIGR00369 family)